jgi:hypothetical protein
MNMMNNWDRELVQFKLHSEINFTKFKSCQIEWSPEVGFWLARRRLLARVKTYVTRLGSPDPCNLMRDCLRSHLFGPRTVSYSNVMIHIEITHKKLSELTKDAPTLRHQHLLDIRKTADDRGDTARSSTILEILTREQEQKKWCRINYTTRPPRGGNPISVSVQSGPLKPTHNTEKSVVAHTSNHLSESFCLAYSAPCYRRQLFDNLGFMGDTECLQRIFEGTYDYPPDTDVWMKKILQEAQHTFTRMSGKEIATMISTADFQQYWRRVDERTSSLFSGITFSHYKAVASHTMLSAMHAAYLTLCARCSIALARWGIGLTVLLEKIVGNNFVHKLRAICLLEADFNWINKIIFARRMIGTALERNLIPGKCFSKKGSNCINAGMTKIFIFDESRIHHHDACIAGNDFGDCYNWAAHPIAALLLWSFGVPQPAIIVLLETMETMCFFLQTGFGESKTSYGGSHEERLTSYGQGNAAAGPGFTAMSSLIANAYLRDGYGAWIYSSYYKRLLILVAVMYVDDTDLVHWSRVPSCTPTELIAAAQTATYAWGGLAIATGAVMKLEKCYTYFLSYWYNRVRAKLRTVKALHDSIALITLPSGETAPSHLRVPLPDGTSATIPTLRNEHASLMLGIYFGPTSGSSTHIQEMAKKVMRGLTLSGLARSHPTLHGRVLSTSSNPE